jgi:hypothetical protein
MKDASSSRAAAPERLARSARCALLLVPAVLAGCYVVPVAPAPGYRYYEPGRYDYPRDYPKRRPYYRGYYGPYGLDTRPGDPAAAAASLERDGVQVAVSAAAPAR